MEDNFRRFNTQSIKNFLLSIKDKNGADIEKCIDSFNADRLIMNGGRGRKCIVIVINTLRMSDDISNGIKSAIPDNCDVWVIYNKDLFGEKVMYLTDEHDGNTIKKIVHDALLHNKYLIGVVYPGMTVELMIALYHENVYILPSLEITVSTAYKHLFPDARNIVYIEVYQNIDPHVYEFRLINGEVVGFQYKLSPDWEEMGMNILKFSTDKEYIDFITPLVDNGSLYYKGAKTWATIRR